MRTTKTKFKKGTALLLSLALSVGPFQTLPHTVIDVQAKEPSSRAFVTKDALMTNFEANGTNTTIGKITFGKNSDGYPVEWYVLGKDSGIEGENIAIFAAEPLMKEQAFEDNAQDNKEYETVSLKENEKVVIENEYGKNVVIIKDGQVYVETADCPDKTCVKQGKIMKTGQSIVCLPHRMTVTITD
jgi:hypothetical protein